MTAIPLPPHVLTYVGRFVARRRQLSVWKAAGIAIAFTLVWMLAWCVVDRIIPLPGKIRLALLITNFAAIAVLLFRPIREILRRNVDWIDATDQIESHNPHFAERLQTITSQLLSPSDLRGSPAILQRIVSEVDTQISKEDPHRLLPVKLIFRPWIAAAICVAVVGVLCTSAWLDLPTLMKRYWSPLSDIGPVTTTRLLIISPIGGNADVVQGEPLSIGVEAVRLPADSPGVVLHTSPDGQTWSAMVMQPAAHGFGTTLTSIDRDVRYFLSGGDAVTPEYQIRVLRRPSVAEFRIRYVYPAYTGREPLTVSNTDGLIEAPVGTEATINICCTEPLTSASISIGDSDKIQATETIEPNVRQVKLTVNKDASYTLKLLSTRAVPGDGPTGMTIRAVPDRPPLVRMLQPADDLRLHPREIVSVQFQALDDYGIESLTANIQIGSTPAKSVPIKLRGDPRRQESIYNLDLAPFALKIGDVVTLSLRAKDTAGQQSSSESRYILISPRSIDLNTHLRVAELKQASLLSDMLVMEVDTSIKALDQARSVGFQTESQFIPAFATFNQHLAAATETTALMRLSLGRAVMKSSSPDLSSALANFVDTVQDLSGTSEEVASLLGTATSQTDPPRQKLAVALAAATTLQQQVRLVAQGEQAAAVLADRGNLLASEKTPPPPEKTAAERFQQTLQRTREDIAAGATEIGLNPQAGDLDAQLQAKIAAAQAFSKAQKPVDFSQVAKAWAALLEKPETAHPIFDQRLAAAAQIESFRPDALLVRAHDLQLAARAAAVVQSADTSSSAATRPAVAEPRAGFPAAIAALQAEHEMARRPNDVRTPDQQKAIRVAANDARKNLAKWAGESIDTNGAGEDDHKGETAEELAMRANAELEKKQYDKAKKTDEKLAGEVSMAPKNPSTNKPEDDSKKKNDPDAPKVQVKIPLVAAAPSIPMPGDPNQQQNSGDKKAGATPNMLQQSRQQQLQQQAEKATDRAKELDRIQQEQDKLREQTKTAHEPDAPSLVKRQQELADAIEDVKRDENKALWGEDMDDADKPDKREEAAAAILAAQEQLAAMPAQLADAQKAANQQRELNQRADAAQKAAQQANANQSAPAQAAAAAAVAARNAQDAADAAHAKADEMASKAKDAADAASHAPPDQAPIAKQASDQAAAAKAQADQAAAQADAAAKATGAQSTAAKAAADQAGAAAAAASRTGDEAKRQADEAKQQLDEKRKPVDPGRTEQLSGNLAKYQPETTNAMMAVDQKLTPALRAMQQAMETNDPGAIDRAIAQARQGIDAVQTELRQAQATLVEKDPLVAAKSFADAAAGAMQRQPPDFAAATSYQTNASAALTQAWGSSVHQAAAARMAQLPALAPMFQMNMAAEGTGAGTGQSKTAMNAVPALREWGRLRTREPEDLSASLRESDPPEYQDALRVYFEALGKSKEEAKK